MPIVLPGKTVEAGILDILLSDTDFEAGGWHIGIGQMADKPDRQLTIRHTGGPPGELAVAIDYPSVQVLARGQVSDGDLAYRKLWATKLKLIGIPSSPAQWPQLTLCKAIGDIQNLGRDDSDRPMYSMNYSLIVSYEDGTSGNRDPL